MQIHKQSEKKKKKDRLIYLIYYSVLAQTRLKAEQLDSRWLGVNSIFKVGTWLRRKLYFSIKASSPASFTLIYLVIS